MPSSLRYEPNDRLPRAWTLWEIMNKFDAFEFGTFLLRLKTRQFQVEQQKRETGGDTPLQQEHRAEINRLLFGERGLAGAFQLCSKIPFTDVLRELPMIEQYLQHDATLSRMQSEIERLAQSIIAEFNKRHFLFVALDRYDFVDNEKLLGESVATVFKTAKDDIREAGNCLAVELNTAAIFHLMRIAEHGLRKLAKTLRVALTHSGHVHPIDFADWDKVITGAKNAIAKARQLALGPKRQGKLEFYSDACDHCLFMKDIWRNTVSHTRKQYTRPEADAAFGRVRDFMSFLAEHL
jgi:hypothetical protein